MKPYTILLPESIANIALAEASEKGVEIGNLCVSVLTDYFLSTNPRKSGTERSQSAANAAATKLDVKSRFVNYPKLSIELAQRFTDETLKLPNVRAFWSGDGIGFDPNFVFIERLKSRDSGITVSFYGAPHAHKNKPSILSKGRGDSYSRAIVNSFAELEVVLPHIKQAYELKFGKL